MKTQEYEDIVNLTKDFVADDCPELVDALLLFVARTLGPIEETKMVETSAGIHTTLRLRIHMVSLQEDEKLVYVGDKRYASDDDFVKGILPVVKRERNKITAKLKKKKG